MNQLLIEFIVWTKLTAFILMLIGLSIILLIEKYNQRKYTDQVGRYYAGKSRRISTTNKTSNIANS